MNKSGSGAVTVHRKVGASTTLNRKYVQRPTSSRVSREKVAEEYRAEQLQRRQALAEKINRENAERRSGRHPLQTTANAAVRARRIATTPTATTTTRPSAKELKEAAIKKALTRAAEEPVVETKKMKTSPKFGFWRILLALGCATASIFAIVYLVNINMPDFSLRVAAMQAGIEATYPSYTPAGYSLNGISSESGKVTINFSSKENNTFSLDEEKSSWDSTTLLNNYIKPDFGENYSTVREHGLTIFITTSAAAWVNGGVAYKLTFTENALTKNQIISLATSL